MNNEFLTTINTNAQDEIKNVVDKLRQLRFDGNLKMYRNLSESLFRLVAIFETTIKLEEYTHNTYSPKTSHRLSIVDLEFLKNLILDLEHEIELLNKKTSQFLLENDFYNHRDSIISYEKIIGLRNKLSPLYEFQMTLHK